MADKKTRSAAKPAATPTKPTGRGSKPTGRGSKHAGERPKLAAVDPEPAVTPTESATTPAEDLDVSNFDDSVIPQITLVAPERTDRSVEDPDAALRECEVRLKLAWKYRTILDPALPHDPPFHSLAWSALRDLRDDVTLSTDATTSAEPKLKMLLAELVALRTVVELTTRPDDPARAALLTGTLLRASHALVDIAPQIIAGARAQQQRFPALTDAALAQADAMLTLATKAVSNSQKAQSGNRLHRIDGADDRQLAWDALLDAIDHLRAAAVTTLRHTRPKLASALSAPLEKSRAKAAPAAPPPAAPPPPAKG